MALRPEKRFEKNAALPGVAAVSSTPTGILVEPVDEARAGDLAVLLGHEGFEQAVDVVLGAGAALRGEARRLVQHDGGAVAVEHHRVGLRQLVVGQLDALALRGAFARAFAAGGHADFLARLDPVLGLGALAVDADLAGARPARDRVEADLRQVPLEPAVQPGAVVVMAHGKAADRVFGCRHHKVPRANVSPATSPARPSTREATI